MAWNFSDYLSLGGNKIMGQAMGGDDAAAAAKKQEQAQADALQRQAGLYARSRNDIAAGAEQGAGAITGYGQQASDALGDSYGNQRRYYSQAGQSMQQGQQGAMGSLESGYGQARSDLGSIDTQSALGSDFQQDPGYQFRLQQGKQALDRAQSASGGRYSGAALKRGMELNSGMASQEFGAAAQRDAQLRGMQMQQGQNQANLAYGYGSQQAGMQNQYGQNMAGLYGQQAGAAQTYGQGQAGLYSNMGSSLAGVYQTQAGQNLQNSGNMYGAYQNYAQVPGMTEQSRANSQQAGMNTAGSILGAL